MYNYANDDRADHIILVSRSEDKDGSVKSDAVLELLERKEDTGRAMADPSGVLTRIFECKAYIGKNGLGKTREGDGKTPLGAFGIVTAFGIKDNPGTSLPYIRIDEHTYCCTEGLYYNRIIDERNISVKPKGEHMIEFVPEYNYGIFLDYNIRCARGKGSAIFMHCMGDKPYTEGCIAVPENAMRLILRRLTAASRIEIF